MLLQQVKDGADSRAARFVSSDFGIDKQCGAIPDPWVILNLVMWLVKCSSVPGIVIAINWAALISHVEVSDDLCLSRVGCEYLCASMKRAARLVKINRLCHVCGDHRIIAARFRNAIHLNREQNRNAPLS